MRYDELFEGRVILRATGGVEKNDAVVENPSRDQMREMLAKNFGDEGLRGILAGRDLYVWNGFYATHTQIAPKLGLSIASEWTEPQCLHIYEDLVELELDLPTKDNMDKVFTLFLALKTNRTLVRFFGGDDFRVQVIAHDNYFDADEFWPDEVWKSEVPAHA